jgi:hypothetical protein
MRKEFRNVIFSEVEVDTITHSGQPSPQKLRAFHSKILVQTKLSGDEPRCLHNLKSDHCCSDSLWLFFHKPRRCHFSSAGLYINKI